MNKKELIRSLYLYSFALLGLVLLVIGSVRLVNLGLKSYIFTEADIYYSYPRPVPVERQVETSEPSEQEIKEYQEKERKSQRQKDVAESLAFLIVGAPLYIYHWSLIKKDKS